MSEESALERPIADAPASKSKEAGALASGSRTVAFWTLISRFSGFARVAAVAAIFGPTYFGNLLQATLLVPYLLCELMAGSLITAMLPPHIVQALEKADGQAAARLARGFLGVLMPVYALGALLAGILAPFVVSLLTMGVEDTVIRTKQIALGVPLLVFLLPQVVFYAVTAVAISVQHAHRRFGLATAAPVIENLGLMLVLGINALLFGVGLDVDEVSLPQLLLLGLGSTAAVGLHSAVQWWGAYRLGVRLIPTTGWREPAVWRIIRAVIPSCGSAALNSLSIFALLVASGSIAGGVIAIQIGMNFFNLPIALSAFPIAFAQSPLLSRYFARSDIDNFSATYRQSLRLTLFFALPACAVFLGMPDGLAAAVSFGAMDNASGISLIAAVLTGLGFGIIGEAVFVVARSSAYARLDAVATLEAMLIRIAIILCGIPVAAAAETVVHKLELLGLSYSIAAMAAAVFLNWRARHAVPRIAHGLLRWFLANGAVAFIATLPASLIAMKVDFRTSASEQHLLTAAALLLASGVLYLLLQFARRSDELRVLLGLTTSPGRSAPVQVEPARSSGTAGA